MQGYQVTTLQQPLLMTHTRTRMLAHMRMRAQWFLGVYNIKVRSSSTPSINKLN